MSFLRLTNFHVHSVRLTLLAVACLLLTAAAAAQDKRDVTINAPDGVPLKASYYRAAQPGPAVMLLHMCNSNRTAWDSVATDLARRGIHVLTLDYRGYGESGGEGGPNAAPEVRQRMQAEKWTGDIDAAYAYLISQPGVDSKRAGAAGGSCGVNQAIHLARRHTEVQSLVLLSGTTDSNGRIFINEADGLPIFASASVDDGDAVALLRWLIGFSRNPANRFVEYKTAGHGTDMFAVEKGLPPMIVEWFDKTVRSAPARARNVSTSARPKPTPTEEFWAMLEKPGGAARARAQFAEAKRRDPNVFLFPEAAANQLGYQLLQGGNAQEAIEVFLLNVEAYPRSANTYDSLGDGYVAAGQRERALEATEKALQLLREYPPENEQTREAIRESAEGKLQTLRGATPGTPAGSAPPPSSAPPAPVANAPRGAAPPPMGQLFAMPIAYSVPGMDAVTIRKDVVYKTVQAPSGPFGLKLDAYIPTGAKPGERFPAVILISGGGGMDGPDWRTAGVYISYGRLLAASGFVGIPYNKRYPRGFAGLVQAEEDTLALVQYLRDHAAELNVDPDRIAVWAFSGGGPLLSTAIGGRMPGVRAILGFYAFLETNPSFFPDAPAGGLDTFSPLAQLKKAGTKTPPIFIGRAGYDRPSLNATNDRLMQEAFAQDVSIEVLNHPTGRHGFDVIDADARTREIIARAIAFLKTHLVSQ